MLIVIWIGISIASWSFDANALSCSHIANVRGCECWT
jgi:hypothetical protein